MTVTVPTACAERDEQSSSDESSEVAVYGAAVSAALDTLGLPRERLVFPDQYVLLQSFTDTESANRDGLEALARRYPRSSVCAYSQCDPEAGETMVFVSRLPGSLGEVVDVAVLTYAYAEGTDFGDGFRMRLVGAGESWEAVSIRRVVVE